MLVGRAVEVRAGRRQYCRTTETRTIKTLFAFALTAALLTSAAQAQTPNNTTRLFDANGNRIGSATYLGKTTTLYDARGNKIGSSTTTGNTTNFYDDRGRKVQSSTTTGTTTNFYHDRGRRTGSASTPTVRGKNKCSTLSYRLSV